MNDKPTSIEHRREVFNDEVYNGLLDFLGEHQDENIGDYFLILDVLNLKFSIEQPALIEFSPCNIPVSALLAEADSEEFAHLGSLIPDVAALDEAIDRAFLSLDIQAILN